MEGCSSCANYKGLRETSFAMHGGGQTMLLRKHLSLVADDPSQLHRRASPCGLFLHSRRNFFEPTTASGVVTERAKVVQTDIAASNCLIHVIGGMMMPN
jgi:hypothetical protein